GARAYQPEHRTVFLAEHRLTHDAVLAGPRPLVYRLDGRRGSTLRDEPRVLLGEALRQLWRIEIVHCVADRLLGGYAAHLAPAAVRPREASLVVLGEDGVRGLRDDGLGERDLLVQGLLLRSPCADVDDGRQVAPRPAALVTLRQPHAVHPDRAAVGAAHAELHRGVQRHLVRLAPALEFGDERIAHALAVLGVDEVEDARPARGVRGSGVAEHLFHAARPPDLLGTHVPVDDPGLRRLHHQLQALALTRELLLHRAVVGVGEPHRPARRT